MTPLAFDWLSARDAWWRHQMETFSALLALFEGNSSVTSEFPSQRAVTRSFDVFFDLHLIRRLDKQSRRRWFDTPLRPLWRHCNGLTWSTEWISWLLNWFYYAICQVTNEMTTIQNRHLKVCNIWVGIYNQVTVSLVAIKLLSSQK